MEKVTIYKKLLNIQKELNVPKGQYNEFGVIVTGMQRIFECL